MTVPSMGYASQLGMGASNVSITEAYEFKSEGLASERTVIKTAGMRGSRSQVIERVRQGTLAPGGPIVLEPSPAELRKLLPRILGAAESGVNPYTYALAETLPTFGVQVDRVAKVFTYALCVVDKATFRSSEGQPLELTLDVEAQTEAITNAGTFQGGLTIDGNPPFVFFDGVLTLGGSSVPMREFELIVDNQLKKDRFTNSQTRTALPPMDRLVTLRCTVPYTADSVALYDGGAAGVTSNLTLTNGSHVLNFQTQNVVFPAKKSPAVQRKDDEVLMTLEGQVFHTTTNPELQVVLTI